jgi:uncharacterized protein (TIGR03086 family)
MTDLLELQRRAAAGFDRRLREVGDDQWELPTPCEGWTVRDLVNHLVYDNVWVPDLMGGATVEEVGDRYEGDLLGDDPVDAWERSIEAALAWFDQPGALDRTVHLSYGDESAAMYLSQRVTDLAVHGWDLARAVGGDERIDPDLVTFLWDTWKPREEMLRASGVFGEPVAVADDADQQTRLLALLGRRP